MNMSVIFRLSITLGVLCSWTRGYSRGAPRATCLDTPGTGHVSGEPVPVTNVSLTPRHGFSPQPGPGPVKILLDQRSIAFTDYIRVTLRSERAFKGFLVTAVGSEGFRIGSWTIPYGDSSSQYIHCQGVQDTVTHTDHSSKRYVLSLQWKPPHGFTGNVTVLASVVMDYRTYWAGLTSDPIMVTSPGVTERDRGSTEIVSLVLVTGERAREERREGEDVEYLYQEDNDVLESVVSTKVFVDFQKRSTENEDEPLENSSTVKTSLEALPRSFDTTSYRSVMLWPKPKKTTTTPASVRRKDTTTSPSPDAVTTFDAWWRLPVTVGANTIQDRFFRPTFFVDSAEDLKSGRETTTYRSVLMKPRSKPSTVKSKPIPTIESQRTIGADNNNYYYGQKEYDEKHDKIKIPVFIDTVDRSDNVLSETDIGVIPYDVFNQDEEELIVSTQSNKFNRLKLNTNQNTQPTTQKNNNVRSNNIPEINADLEDDEAEPYAKMESEYGSWENGATQTTNISVGLMAILFYWLWLV